jgi:hypothetical protein
MALLFDTIAREVVDKFCDDTCELREVHYNCGNIMFETALFSSSLGRKKIGEW